MESNGCSLGLLGHSVSEIDIFADVVEVVLVEDVGRGGVCADGGRQRPMHQDVGVAADGRGEVRVDGRRQPVVPAVTLETRAEIHRLNVKHSNFNKTMSRDRSGEKGVSKMKFFF